MFLNAIKRDAVDQLSEPVTLGTPRLVPFELTLASFPMQIEVAEHILVPPHEISPRVRETAMARFASHLSARPDVMEVVAMSLDGDRPKVQTNSGALKYSGRAQVVVYSPKEQDVIPAAEIVDIVTDKGVFLAHYHVHALLPAELVTIHEGSHQVLIRGRIYRVGDSVPVKIVQMKRFGSKIRALVELERLERA
jgi:DNA-directed RNA polymerase subunit E'/Rpb7